MINIVKKICDGKFMNKTPLSDLLPILSHRHSVNIYCKKSPVAEKLLVAAFAF